MSVIFDVIHYISVQKLQCLVAHEKLLLNIFSFPFFPPITSVKTSIALLNFLHYVHFVAFASS